MPEKIIKTLDNAQMYQPFVKRVRLAMKFANDYYFHGRVRISETYRTLKRQEELYAKGRTTEGKIVTHAKPGSSYHNLGCAVDLFILTHDNKYETNLQPYKQLSGIMVQFGLQHLRSGDYPHWQVATNLDLPALYKKYKAEGMNHKSCVLRIHSDLNKERIIYNAYVEEEVS